MKKIYLLLIAVTFVSTSCSVKIPLQSNLSDQTMLLAKNKDIKAEYVLSSAVQNGPLAMVSVQRNGKESVNENAFEYDSEIAFAKIWDAYFSSKFNSYAEDTIEIEVSLLDLYLKQVSSTSAGESLLTGNAKYNVEAIAVLEFTVNYEGKTYKNSFEVNASEYNESQSMQAGGVSYTKTAENPTRQKSKLLESCFNRSIIQFENYINSVVLKDE